MGDDGIGPRLIAELRNRGTSGADLIDLGTGGIQLVHVLARYESVVLIDAADIGLDPGDFKTFGPDEAVSMKTVQGYSLHEWDLMRSIEISMALGEAPKSIVIFAIQPRSTSMGEGISPELEMEMEGFLDSLDRLILD
jgi:hydrogenase maturation protease